MNKYLYNLSYIDDGVVKSVDLSIFSKLSGKNLHEINNIDEFTTIYSNEEELINTLKYLKLVPFYVSKLYLSYTLNKEEYIIYNGDILLFKDDIKKLNIGYIKMMFNKFKENPNKLLKLANEYYKKYGNSKGMLDKAKELLFYANLKKESNFYFLGYDEIRELNDSINKFFDKEFYSNTKQGKVTKYLNIRDFVVKEKYVDEKYLTDREHSYLNYNPDTKKVKKSSISTNNITKEIDIEENDKEEFLTLDDFDRSNGEILKNYSPNYEAYQDGIDYMSPISKKELKNTLGDIAKTLSLKPGDGDFK